VNLKRSICTAANEGYKLKDLKKGSTEDRKNQEEVTEVGLSGSGSGDFSVIDTKLHPVHRQISERINHRLKAMG